MSPLERIVRACGGILLDHGKRALIPGPGHSPNDRSVSLIEREDGRILVHCFSPHDDWRAVRAELAQRGLLDETTNRDPLAAGRTRELIALQPAEEAKVARARRLWEEAKPIQATFGERYLRYRERVGMLLPWPRRKTPRGSAAP